MSEPTSAAPAAEPTPAAVVDPPPALDQVVADAEAAVDKAGHDTVTGVEQVVATDKADLHPAVSEVLQFFSSLHLPQALQEVARPFETLAHHLAATLKGSQLTLALHHLLSAKDAAVRAKVAADASASTQNAASADTGSAAVAPTSAS